ncbi:MAG TPA: Xaa-Pro peptidase family protein [Stellaceae bacterium]|nr:Xaa-Pro peptidase family protein [Stellaceae bacterium]
MVSGEGRLAATARYLEERGLDALVAFNNGQNSFLESNAVFVLSGVRPIGESAVLVDRTGTASLIVTPAWDEARAAAQSRTQTAIGADDLPAALGHTLKAHRVDSSKLVTVGLGTLGLALVRRIEAALGGTPPAQDDFTRNLARVRAPEELEAARKATWIAERGYERMLEFVRPGMREFELAAELYCCMKELGAEDNFLLVSASQHNLAVRAAGRRMLDAGDIILSEITPCYRGQYAQICRTTVIGEPGAALAEKYALLQDAMRRGQEAALPGARVRDVCKTIDDCFRAAGYGDFCKPPFMRVRGHGLGVTSDRPGDLTADSDTMLEEGMVFVMHPNQYLPETGYMMCGEPVVITPGGAEALSQRMATLDAVPA